MTIEDKPSELAERGVNLKKQHQQQWDDYEMAIYNYFNGLRASIWSKTYPDQEINSLFVPSRTITATDSVNRYLNGKYTNLFKDLWLNHLECGAGPHDYWKKSKPYKNKVTVGLEFSGYAGGGQTFIEDSYGLGVNFEGFFPRAYGPRQFALRVFLVNKRWVSILKEPEHLQTILLVAENIAGLEFKPLI